MPGASAQTRRVAAVNANFSPDGGDGVLEVLVVTEDGARHTMVVSSAAATAVIALTQASDVLLWDPAGPALIAANLHGRWLPPDWSGMPEASSTGDADQPDRSAS